MGNGRSTRLIIQKFGGSSVATLERIRRVAAIIRQSVMDGNQVVAVVSAMAGETNRLLALAAELDIKTGRELDVLLASGEQASASLLAMVLQKLGVPALSYCGYQVRIHTTSDAQQARIESIESEHLLADLQQNKVPVVAGFQGINEAGEITTLGRGGSDLTAVALAAALGADECQIFTDTDGVYTADPRIVPTAQKIDTIELPLMAEYAAAGAKVLQSRCLDLAMRSGVPVRILSSYMSGQGTRVEPKEPLEGSSVSGIASQAGYELLQIRQLPQRPGLLSYALAALSTIGLVPDMLQFSGSELTLAVKHDSLTSLLPQLQVFAEELGSDTHCFIESNLVKLSVIGSGMGAEYPVFTTICRVLSKEGVDPRLFSACSTRIEVLLPAEEAIRVNYALHQELLQKE